MSCAASRASYVRGSVGALNSPARTAERSNTVACRRASKAGLAAAALDVVKTWHLIGKRVLVASPYKAVSVASAASRVTVRGKLSCHKRMRFIAEPRR